jgi:hypothetical protein
LMIWIYVLRLEVILGGGSDLYPFLLIAQWLGGQLGRNEAMCKCF